MVVLSAEKQDGGTSGNVRIWETLTVNSACTRNPCVTSSAGLLTGPVLMFSANHKPVGTSAVVAKVRSELEVSRWTTSHSS